MEVGMEGDVVARGMVFCDWRDSETAAIGERGVEALRGRLADLLEDAEVACLLDGTKASSSSESEARSMMSSGKAAAVFDLAGLVLELP